MTEPFLKVQDLVKRFGGLVATDHLSLAVMPGEIHAIIGPNGAGKTTLIAQLFGTLRPDSGQIYFAGTDISQQPPHKRSALGLARSFQITSIFKDFTVEENVMVAAQAHDGHSFRFWKSMIEDPRLRAIAEETLDRIGLLPRAQVIAANLSHGEQRQLEIAMALATKPKLLLLDEPMAGMGPEESVRMIETLRQIANDHTIVLVEHDMDAVFSLADRITVLVYGRAIATGGPAEIRANPEVREAYLGAESV